MPRTPKNAMTPCSTRRGRCDTSWRACGPPSRPRVDGRSHTSRPPTSSGARSPPGTTTGASPATHPESLLVLYLGHEEAVRAVAARLGAEPVAPANPYWADHGLTFEDPDGFRVVLVPEPWVP